MSRPSTLQCNENPGNFTYQVHDQYKADVYLESHLNKQLLQEEQCIQKSIPDSPPLVASEPTSTGCLSNSIVSSRGQNEHRLFDSGSRKAHQRSNSKAEHAIGQSVRQHSSDHAKYTDSLNLQVGLGTLTFSKTSLGGFGKQISKLGAADQQLVQWYLIPRSPIDFAKDFFFPWMSESAVGLNGVLFFGIVFGGFSEGEKHGQRLLTQRARLISSIKTSLEDTEKPPADEILFGIGFMVVSESLLGHVGACTAHMNGLMRIVRARGGLKGIYKNRRVCASLMMNEIHLYNHRASQVAIAPETQDNMEVSGDWDDSNLSKGRQIIFSLLLMLQKQTNVRRMEIMQKTSHVTEKLLALFDRSTPLYHALASETLPSKSHASLGHRLTFLLYINYCLAEFQYCPKSTISFLENLSQIFTHGSASTEDEVYKILFTLLREMPEAELRRLWWVIRVMRATTTVRAEATGLLHEILLWQLRLVGRAEVDVQLANLDRLWDIVEVGLEGG